MARILITGCSYGCGEWQRDNPLRLHRGTAQYLEEAGHEVKNLSRGGSNNWICIDRMKSLHQEYDYVIYMMTAVSRDFLGYDTTKTALENAEQKAQEIVNNVWDMCGPKTIMVGALYKIPANDYKFVAQFNGIDLLVPDNQWPEVYVNSHDFIKLHYNTQGPMIIDLLTFKREILNCNDDLVWQTMKDHPEWFEPDGVHWNRQAHKVVADKILEYIK
jgi:hypothetical protein